MDGVLALQLQPALYHTAGHFTGLPTYHSRVPIDFAFIIVIKPLHSKLPKNITMSYDCKILCVDTKQCFPRGWSAFQEALEDEMFDVLPILQYLPLPPTIPRKKVRNVVKTTY